MAGKVSPPLWSIGAAEAGRRIASGDLDPCTLLDAHLERAGAVEQRIHSFIHIAEPAARQAARFAADELAAGRRRSPLHGVPFAVKDNYDAVGMPATAGSRLRLDHIPTADAALVADLKAAGGVLMGKLSTWEFGTGNGGEYFDLPFPPARNPWDPERFTGGSSSGAGAAVAAGTTSFALGSDTTGSVRLPAAACGLVGVIMSPGRLTLDGILPNCYALDVPGPLTWTVEDAAVVLDVLARPSPALAGSLGRSVTGLRIGVLRGPLGRFPQPDAAMLAAFDDGIAVLERLGAKLVDVLLPASVSDCFDVTRLIGPAESAAIHEKELRERPQDMGYALRDKLMAGSLVRAVDYIQALRQRRLIAGGVDALIRGVDALVTYGPLHVAPRLGVEPEMTAFTVETMLTPFNLSAHPALVQPIGFSPDGLPLSWQLVTNRDDEATLIAVASAFEQATTWRQRRPIL